MKSVTLAITAIGSRMEIKDVPFANGEWTCATSVAFMMNNDGLGV